MSAEEAARAHPDDVEAHLVYADWLQAQGDPYGELIVIQHPLATAPTPALRRREQRWFATHFEVPIDWDLT